MVILPAGSGILRPTRTLVNIPAFSFDQLRFDWGDVALAAIGWGEWQELEREVAAGIACAAQAERLDDEAVHAATVEFRRARGLVSGHDYLLWLERRSLSTADLRAYLTRALLRARAGDEGLAGALAASRPDAQQLAAVVRAEAILGGGLRRWAERLARCASAARGLMATGEGPPAVSGDVAEAIVVGAGAPAVSSAMPEAIVAAAAACPAAGLTDADARSRAPRIASLQAAERAFSEAVVTRERIERCLVDHRLDWQRFVWEEAAFASEGAAREAALWVREEGMPLAEVAALAHAAAHVGSAYADEVPELAGLLAATAPGELIGPLSSGAQWRLVSVLERRPPGSDDSALRERARTALVLDALERHLAGRVSWYGEL